MPSSEIDARRSALELERDRLRQQLAQLGHGDQAEGLTFDENFADSGQVTAERGEVDAIAAELDEALHDVDDALARFEQGTYGRCEQCANPIAEARLEALPAARLCITCASPKRR